MKQKNVPYSFNICLNQETSSYLKKGNDIFKYSDTLFKIKLNIIKGEKIRCRLVSFIEKSTSNNFLNENESLACTYFSAKFCVAQFYFHFNFFETLFHNL